MEMRHITHLIAVLCAFARQALLPGFESGCRGNNAWVVHLQLANEWPGARLAEIWNSFAGVAPFSELKPVKKFTDRKSAVARIWAAIQRLSPDDAPQASDVASRETKNGVTLKIPLFEGSEARGVTRNGRAYEIDKTVGDSVTDKISVT